MQDFVTFFQLQSVKISRPLRFGKADYDAISRSTTVRTRNEEIDIILPFPSSQYQPFPFLLPVGLQLSEPLTTGFRMLTNFQESQSGCWKRCVRQRRIFAPSPFGRPMPPSRSCFSISCIAAAMLREAFDRTTLG